MYVLPEQDRVPQGDVPFSIQGSLFPASQHYAKTTVMPTVWGGVYSHFHAGAVSGRHDFLFRSSRGSKSGSTASEQHR
jgi:hypothetical protein